MLLFPSVYVECVTGQCKFSAEAEVFYTGFDGDEDSVKAAFFTWVNNLYGGTVLNSPSDTTQTIGQSNDATLAGGNVSQEEVGTSSVGLVVAGTLVALVGVGAAFFMHRRRRGGHSTIEEDRSLVLDANDTRREDASIGFPVSSNSLNNEYEVLGREIY